MNLFSWRPGAIAQVFVLEGTARGALRVCGGSPVPSWERDPPAAYSDYERRSTARPVLQCRGCPRRTQFQQWSKRSIIAIDQR